MENRSEFYLTPHPKPEMKFQYKYQAVIDKNTKKN